MPRFLIPPQFIYSFLFFFAFILFLHLFLMYSYSPRDILRRAVDLLVYGRFFNFFLLVFSPFCCYPFINALCVVCTINSSKSCCYTGYAFNEENLFVVYITQVRYCIKFFLRRQNTIYITRIWQMSVIVLNGFCISKFCSQMKEKYGERKSVWGIERERERVALIFTSQWVDKCRMLGRGRHCYQCMVPCLQYDTFRVYAYKWRKEKEVLEHWSMDPNIIWLKLAK